MKKVFIILAAMATMVACCEQNEQNKISPADLAGEWTILQIGENALSDSVESQLVFIDSLNIYSAHVGCNRINGTWLFADSLVLTDGLSTRMYCEGLMEAEQALCIALPQIKQATTLENGEVALQNIDGETLVVVKR